MKLELFILITPFFFKESSSLTPEEDKKMVPPPAPSSRPTMVPQVTVEEENHSPKVVHSDLSPVTEEPSSGADQVRKFYSASSDHCIF